MESLINRLEIGDIIRAKVIEARLNEALLRLFDGSVLKARISDDVELEKGQTVTLEVKSRSNTTIELKTVKDPSGNTASLSTKPQELLEALDISADEANTRIASEFLKYGIKPDARQIKNAADMVSSSDVFDIEKATYLIAKGLDKSIADHGTVSRFLDGGLKLGKLLDTLYDVLSRISDGSSEAAENTPSETSSNIPFEAHDSSTLKSAVNKPYTASESINSETTDNIPPGASDNVPFGSADKTISESSDDVSLLLPKADEKAVDHDTGAVGRHDMSGLESAHNSKTENKTEITASDLKKSIERLFVKADRELSDKELDSNVIKNRISDLISKTEHYINTSKHTAAAEDAIKTTSSLNDTLKLLDMMNSCNVMYYQIPLQVSGSKTNAELYVMNRRRGRRRIDPQDTVVFLSVDTLNLGRVEMLLELKGNGVSIDLRTGSREVNDFIKANIKGLYTSLEECGRKLSGIKYSILKEASSVTEQEKILQNAARMKHERVDLRI